MAFFKSNNESFKEADADKNIDQALEIIKSMQKDGKFEIAPYEYQLDFKNNNLQKLPLGSVQKMRINSLVQHIPAALSTATMAQAYVVRFPEGYPHTLMRLTDGG